MPKPEGKIQYFLGANSVKGFASLYDKLIDETKANALYILKGGAGCGKSTLMKIVGERLEEHGLLVEYIHCSGDPDSLDGILIPEKKTAVVDGTAPHGEETKQHKKSVRNARKGESSESRSLHSALQFQFFQSVVAANHGK